VSGRIEEKVAIVTGGASGIGEATVRRFADEGAHVIAADIQDAEGQRLAAELGPKVTYLHCDVTVEGDVRALIDAAVAAHGRLDIMMNNAGILGARAPIDEIDLQEFKITNDVLVNGTFLGLKHAARIMKPLGSGSIINVASTAGINGGFGPHAYSAAKHAIVGLTKNVAAELCRFGVRVNCVAPSGVMTPLAAHAHIGDHQAMDALRDRLMEVSPLKGRPGLAEDVANAALFLASDESGFTNGHCLTTDGGFTTGSKAGPPPHSEAVPFAREAGKTGV
jgi:NAD(P)-dependent dehydrogenase (short-subunit alcohol dehydrogenase family)